MNTIEDKYARFMSERLLYACSHNGQIKIEVKFFTEVDEETLKKRRKIKVTSKVYLSEERQWISSEVMRNIAVRLKWSGRIYTTRDKDLSIKYARKLMRSIQKDFKVRFFEGECAYAVHTLYADKEFINSNIFKRWLRDKRTFLIELWAERHGDRLSGRGAGYIANKLRKG